MSPKQKTVVIGGPNLASEEFRVSEGGYRSLIEANGVAYLILDPDGKILAANQHYAASAGYRSLNEILGRNICDLVVPLEKEICARALEMCLRDGNVRNVETKYLSPEGKVTVLLLNAAVERLDGAVRILALGSDITARKQEETLWRRESEFTKAVFDSAPFLLLEYDDQLRLIRWNKQAEVITGHSATDLYEKSLFDLFSEAELPRIHEALRSVRRNGHANIEARLTMKNGTQVPHHYTAVRLKVDEREFFICIGVDVTPLKQVEQALRDSELRLQTLIENAAVPISMGREGVLIYANSRYLSMLGYESAGQITGTPVLDRFAPQCREQIGDFIRRKEQEHPAPSEYESICLRADGTQFPVLVALTNVLLADGPVSFICLTDISSRKHAEESIRAERDKAELYLQVAEVILVALDSDGTIKLINRKGCQILGYIKAELLGKNWFELCIPVERYKSAFAMFQSIVAGEIGSREYQEDYIQAKDGRQRLIAWHNSQMRDESDRVIGTLSSGEDITDRKRSEEALLVRSHAIASAINGVAIADLEGNVNYANDSFLRMWGYETAKDVLGQPQVNFWHSAERASQVQNLTLRDGSYVGEGTAKKKDGSFFTAQIAATVTTDADGRPICLMSSFLDITDRKLAEEELGRVNEQLSIERETLRRKNVALQELLAQISVNRQSLSAHIQSNIEKIVLPILDRLPARLDSRGKNLLSLAQSSLRDITSPFVSALGFRSRNLTQREVEMCELIRRGHGSKEIAELRGCSVQTVSKQRKVIRKKLGITGKQVNLASFLAGLLPGLGSPTSEKETKQMEDIEL